MEEGALREMCSRVVQKNFFDMFFSKGLKTVKGVCWSKNNPCNFFLTLINI